MASPITDFSKLCVHTMTTKPWSLHEAIGGYVRAGVPGITVWRNAIESIGAKEAATIVDRTRRNGDRDDRNERRSGGLAALRTMAIDERAERIAEMDANCAARAVSSVALHARAHTIAAHRGLATAGLLAG